MGNGREINTRGLTNREYGDLERMGGDGLLILTEGDMDLPFEDGGLHLKQSAKQALPGVPIPKQWQEYRRRGMECVLDLGTRLGQAGLNLRDQYIDDDGILQSTIVNEGPHIYAASTDFDIGKIVAKGAPLRGDEFLDALRHDVSVKPEGLVLNPVEGLIWAPITKRFQYHGTEKTIQIPEIPRGHDRSGLHRELGIVPVGISDSEESVLDSSIQLAATDGIAFSKNHCMWVVKGLKIIEGKFIEVEHGAARLLKPGDRKWRIMTETLGEIDYIGLELYNSLTI